MSDKSTIVITGVGCINALGKNVKQFSKNLLAGVNGIAPITFFDKERVTYQYAAEVKNYSAEVYFPDRKQLKFLDRFAQFALISAREAVENAGLVPEHLVENTAVICGTGIGGLITLDENYNLLYGQQAKRFPPFTLPKLIPSSAASHISIDLGITGPSMGLTSACASSGHAIAMGVMMLQSEQCKVALCGGAESILSEGGVKVWEAMRVLSKDYCRPFSAGRGGVILGEGSAHLVLETKEHALERGANILAEVAGFGMSSDASHFVSPSVDGPVNAMQKALKHAKLNVEDIDYINAHGSGTEQNDIIETSAIHRVFGEYAKKVAISSTKSMHGHNLGAASAIEASACITALQQQCAPATINYLDADPNCDLDYIPNESRSMEIKYAMSNSFAFGGLNVSLIFKRSS